MILWKGKKGKGNGTEKNIRFKMAKKIVLEGRMGIEENV